MNFSLNSGHCKVEYYKPSGKWYMDEVIDMSDHYNDVSIHNAIRESIIEGSESVRHGRGESLLRQFIAVVSDPYHANAYPIMLIPDDILQMIIDSQQ